MWNWDTVNDFAVNPAQTEGKDHCRLHPSSISLPLSAGASSDTAGQEGRHMEGDHRDGNTQRDRDLTLSRTAGILLLNKSA